MVRRKGIERRQRQTAVPFERRSGKERRFMEDRRLNKNRR